MRSKTCCFSGHRKIPPMQSEQIAERLRAEIMGLISAGYVSFFAGGALGFDTMAELAVLKIKQSYPQIKLTLALPCKIQTRGWDKNDIQRYEEIKRKSDNVIYTSEEYTSGCMFKRNRYLVDNSSVCVCYLTEDSGGTAYTVGYAKKEGLKTINLA